MNIAQAQEIVEQNIGRETELIQSRKMRNRITVVITDDRIQHDKRLPVIRTRRLSIFQRETLLGQFIIDTMRE